MGNHSWPAFLGVSYLTSRKRRTALERTPYLLLQSFVSFRAVVIDRSSDHVHIPPTSWRLSKRVALNPSSRSSLRAAIPAGPELHISDVLSFDVCYGDLPPPTMAIFVLMRSMALIASGFFSGNRICAEDMDWNSTPSCVVSRIYIVDLKVTWYCVLCDIIKVCEMILWTPGR